MKYCLGLDLGITSIGWALFLTDDDGNIVRIENLGVRIFKNLEDKDGKLENAIRRQKRSSRRLRRRKQGRLNKLKDLYREFFGVNNYINEINYKDYENPYALKIKGLSQKLTKEELMIALYHYCKFRGFKSNRKNDKAENDGNLIRKFKEINQQLSEKNCTITEYLYNNYLNMDQRERRIHNFDKTYTFTATREMYLNEINILLDKQIECKLIDESFKNKYLDIFSSQISYSVGPGFPSKWGASNGQTLIEKMIGRCKFDGNLRASKGSFSAASFVFLSFLNNCMFKEKEKDTYRHFTSEEIKKLYDLAKTKEKLTYNKIFKYLNISVIRVKGLETTKKKYNENLKKFKEKYKIKINEKLDNDQYRNFLIYNDDILFDKEIPSLKSYCSQVKVLKQHINENNKNEINDFLSDYNNFDVLSDVLLKNKVDDEIKNELIRLGYSEEISEILLECESISKTIDLSLDICKQLIPYLLDGNTYDEAMAKCSYNHSDLSINIEKHQYLPPIEDCIKELNEAMPNPVVHHTLIELRKLLNEIIKKYGYIDTINIELVRDLALSNANRKQVMYNQIDNANENMYEKAIMLNKYPQIFKKFEDISKNDLIKYKLFKEQKQKSPYSGLMIDETQLFNNNMYQIDHIMPYSRTFEDKYFNKVLVETEYNQLKGNKLPYEAFHNNAKIWNNIISFINDKSIFISDKKREALLLKNLEETEWKERNLQDTKYASKLAKRIIDTYLKPNKCLSVPGAMTDLIKRQYGINNFTHSIISKDYKNSKNYYIYVNDDLISKEKDTIKIKFKLILNNTEEILDISSPKINTNSSRDDIELNNAMIFFYQNPNKLKYVIDLILKNEQNLFSNVVEECCKLYSKSLDINQQEIFKNMLIILSRIQVYIDRNKKDRSNNLHHILDACAIATINAKNMLRIQKWAQRREMVTDPETGEIVADCKLELPYKDFVNEIKYRVYERDYNTLIAKLKTLDNYRNCDFNPNNIYVVNPSRSPNKNITGAFTQETLYGCRNGKILKKISVKDIKVDNKTKDIDKNMLESIYNENNGQHAVIESIRNWIKNNKLTEWPILETKGTYIKNIRIIVTDNLKSKVKLKREGNIYAENTDVIRVDVYKCKEDDSKIYMVPIYYFQKVKEKMNQNVYYTLMSGCGNNDTQYVSKEWLEANMKLVCQLPRYSLINIKMKDGRSSLCYSGGVTSGQFEVYSIINDDFDLLENKFVSKVGGRCRLTISSIKDIEVHNISLLGKIN